MASPELSPIYLLQLSSVIISVLPPHKGNISAWPSSLQTASLPILCEVLLPHLLYNPNKSKLQTKKPHQNKNHPTEQPQGISKPEWHSALPLPEVSTRRHSALILQPQDAEATSQVTHSVLLWRSCETFFVSPLILATVTVLRSNMKLPRFYLPAMIRSWEVF